MPTARAANLAAVRGRFHPPFPPHPGGPTATALLTVLGLLAVVVLTLGTAVAVASEFSLTALERSQVDGHAAQAGDRRARAIQRAHRDLSFELSGCQLAITITTLVTGYIAEPAVASLIRPGLIALGMGEGLAAGLATVLALLLATALSMVFGELMPKNIAIADPLRTARAVVWLQGGFARAFRRLIAALNASANAVVRRLGVEPAQELRSARSAEELGALVRASGERGTLHAGTATLMDRSLRFTDRVAGDLMTPRAGHHAGSRADPRRPRRDGPPDRHLALPAATMTRTSSSAWCTSSRPSPCPGRIASPRCCATTSSRCPPCRSPSTATRS